MTLVEAKEGKNLIIKSTGNDELTNMALRFGIGVGSNITIVRKIPNGPVIVSRNELEIALGRQLALAIEVEDANA
jgi:Fe2+ transport system protein FeoA